MGASVVRALIYRGDDVNVLDSGVAAGFDYLDGVPARLIRGYLRDGTRSLMRSGTACLSVVHLAAQTSVPESIAKPVEDLAANVDASVFLLETMRTRALQNRVRLVQRGRWWTPSPAREELDSFPVSPYGAAKASIESYLKAYQQAYGLHGVSLRFANAYGRAREPQGQRDPDVREGLSARRSADHPRHRQPDARLHSTSTTLTYAILLCLDARSDAIAGRVYQIGTGVETSLLELANKLFEVGATRGDLSSRREPGDVARNVSDISLVRRELGFAPRVGLREGLTGTLEWFRGNWHG